MFVQKCKKKPFEKCFHVCDAPTVFRNFFREGAPNFDIFSRAVFLAELFWSILRIKNKKCLFHRKFRLPKFENRGLQNRKHPLTVPLLWELHCRNRKRLRNYDFSNFGNQNFRWNRHFAKNTLERSRGMLPRKIFKKWHTVVAMLVLFEQFLGKFCLKFLPLNLSVSPNMMHFVCTFSIMRA